MTIKRRGIERNRLDDSATVEYCRSRDEIAAQTKKR
jgi:hypothetical protein